MLFFFANLFMSDHSSDEKSVNSSIKMTLGLSAPVKVLISFPVFTSKVFKSNS